ncbi:Protein argonaute [Elasticomyces elasticus]|nr:Protein argonaute [Elasticomyces elasticus]KAK5766757.1 Protein argonaute [Elasticomyces elasticus]
MGLLGSSNAKLKEDGARYGDGRDDSKHVFQTIFGGADAAGDDTAEDTIWGRRLLDTSKSFDNLENVHRDLSLKIEEVISYEQKRMDLLIHSPARKGPPSTIFDKKILQTFYSPFGPASAIPAWTPTAASGVWQSVRPPIEHAVSAADATAAWAAYTATASRFLDRNLGLLVDLESAEGGKPKKSGKENKHRIVIKQTNTVGSKVPPSCFKGKCDFDNRMLESINFFDHCGLASDSNIANLQQQQEQPVMVAALMLHCLASVPAFMTGGNDGNKDPELASSAGSRDPPGVLVDPKNFDGVFACQDRLNTFGGKIVLNTFRVKKMPSISAICLGVLIVE